jgi:hypothetical protein
MECYRELGVLYETVAMGDSRPQVGESWPMINRECRARMSAEQLSRAFGVTIKPHVARLWEDEQFHVRVAQKTEGWHTLRNKNITGSRVGGILRLHNYSNTSPYSIMRGFWFPETDTFRGSAATRHGERYEDIAAAAYESHTGDFVLPFDYIRCPEPEFHHCFAFSPDGITASGRLLEIKCPWSRPIIELGYPPHYIFGQVMYSLFCLRTVGISECDYVEFDPHQGVMHIARIRYDPMWEKLALADLVEFHNVLMEGFEKGPVWCEEKLEQMKEVEDVRRLRRSTRSHASKRRLMTWAERLADDYAMMKKSYEEAHPPPPKRPYERDEDVQPRDMTSKALMDFI